jgi:hypothetical protein
MGVRLGRAGPPVDPDLQALLANVDDHQALRRTALSDTELARAQVGTIRPTLLKVAARVVVSVRRVMFHLASSYPYRAVFREALLKLTDRRACQMAGTG